MSNDSPMMYRLLRGADGVPAPSRLVLAGLLFWAAASAAPAEPKPFSKGPYLQAPGSTRMVIMWESLTSDQGTVHYGLEGRVAQAVKAGPPRRMEGVSSGSSSSNRTSGASSTNARNRASGRTNIFYVSEVLLTNLQPGARYTYAVELGGTRTEPRPFKTFSPNPETVRFLVYGDTRSLPHIHGSLAKQFKQHAPEFILHTGDLVAKGKDYGLWSKEFFNPLEEVMAEIPLLPTIGNHEEDGTNYLAYFHLPGQERWYAFDVGPVHVLVLDYHYAKSSEPQFVFASRDLAASRAPWKLVMVHYPVFNIGGHGTAWGHEAYLPLFRRTKVDLVLSGHSHLYERFWPVSAQDEKGQWAITHMTTGGGGAELVISLDHPALASRIGTNHYVLLEASRERLAGRTLLVDGSVFDTFELRKPGGTYAPEYLARAYPEEWLKVSLEAATQLQGRLASVPTEAEPADVMFGLRPLKSCPEPVDLELSIAPHSMPYYEMVERPGRVQPPGPGEPEKLVWAKVRATGELKVSANKKTGELSPALIFEATLVGEGGETVAYGQKSRVSDTAARAARNLR